MSVHIETNAIDELRANFLGELLLPGDLRYDEARSIWNGRIDRRPALIARCVGAADVVAAVRFARDRELPAAVRGGGHAVAGHALCDDGLVIDLSPMRGTRLDLLGSTIRVQGGCLNEHLDRESQAFGLATTAGIHSLTGIGGLTLGGGIGHLMRKHGLTADNLVSCDVVTAQGEFLVTSEEENPDLFWGLRGGGGNFGVVTSFQFRLHPLEPIVTAGLVAWPMDKAPEVLRLLRQIAADAPDELGIMANLRLAPSLPTWPEALHGKPVVALIVCYAGPLEEGERIVRPIREFGTTVLDAVTRKPYVAHQKMFNLAVPTGLHYYWKGHRLPPLSDEIIDVLIEHASRITSPLTTIGIYTLGGAVGRIDENATAFANRDAAHEINITAAWQPDDPEPGRHIDWARAFFAALEPHSRGVYVNYINDDAANRVRETAYGANKWSRLVALKGKYDPTNFFRFNANVPPKAGDT
jgi:FAD binding domain/Berberine and berberine like